MKKLSVLLVAVLMVLAITLPAAAFENEFGGYFRTRFYSEQNFSGDTSDKQDETLIDTRTRLFYTAKFSDNLKFVNKFEFNTNWGQDGSYGQLSADSVYNYNYFRVKNSYVDFKLGEQQFKVGVQGLELNRGFVLSDDVSAVFANFKVNDALYLPLIYAKVFSNTGGNTTASCVPGKTTVKYPDGTTDTLDDSRFDVDAYVFQPMWYINKDNLLKVNVATIQSDNMFLASARTPTPATGATGANPVAGNLDPLEGTKLNFWSAAVDYDGKFDNFTFGATAIKQFGSLDDPMFLNSNVDSLNFNGYLLNLFGAAAVGPANFRLKGIYASGEKTQSSGTTTQNSATPFDRGSNNYDQYMTLGNPESSGTSYYWAEILGAGIFDNQTPAGTSGDHITDYIIGNAGFDYKLLPDLKAALDVYYVRLADDRNLSPYSYTMLTGRTNWSSDVGTELDLDITYTLVDNLKLDLVGAYCWAGDVINKAVYTTTGTNKAGQVTSFTYAPSANPIEFGTQLSLAF